MENFPEGKFLTTVKIGPKGQIVIKDRLLFLKRYGICFR